MQTAPHVKICGLTNLEDAELACSLGVWALGMIFYEGSPRRCSAEAAQQIAARLRRRAELCGVYVNAPLDEIAANVDTLGLTLVQLHGDEGPAFCGEVKRRTGARVIKAAQVRGAGDVRALERFHVDFHLFDAPGRRGSARGPALRGGTGETFDWSVLAARRSKVPMILSGGLQPGNVAEAIAATHPYALDSASGTEAAPGHKDPQLLRDFVAAVRSAAGPNEPEPRPEPEPTRASQPADAPQATSGPTPAAAPRA
jgi:phosphoribosylanthranilate isomerase